MAQAPRPNKKASKIRQEIMGRQTNQPMKRRKSKPVIEMTTMTEMLPAPNVPESSNMY